LPFAAYEVLADRPHVMVDGAARPTSVLTLSHWPQSPTPSSLARDVSAASVLEYVRLLSGDGWAHMARSPASSGRGLREALERGRLAEAVTNDHFDEDGLMSVFALVDPATALAAADLLVAVAMCGDFGVVADEAAARVSFAITPLAEAEAGVGSGTSERYRAVLPVVADLLARPDAFSSYWSAEVAELAAGRAAIERGEVVISEHAGLDLAVVTAAADAGGGRLPGAGEAAGGRLLGAAGGLPVHAAAVHSATAASRIIAFDGPFAECYLRYEGWVRTVSRRVPLRPDLAPLAAQLSAEEPSGLEWEANSVGAIVGRLHPSGDGRTEIDRERIIAVIKSYLATAPPAWDPWREGGGLIPLRARPGYRPAYGRRLRSRRRPRS
jgi:hypothetical protein